MKVALFAPWPPQRSGIADYSYRLAEGLVAKNVELEIFTAATSPAPLEGCVVHQMTADSGFCTIGDAFPVFQLGNNASFHSFQPGALARIGGLVHLHDLVLHHFHLDRTLGVGNGGYWEDLEFWYGHEVARACERLIELGTPPWSNAAVMSIPLFEPYLQFADAVVVHSQSALRTIEHRMPSLRGYCLPQCYPISPPPLAVRRPTARPLSLGVFGWVEPHKRIDQILAAMAELRVRGVDVRLDICGPAGATMGGLVDEINSRGLGSVVRLRGHLEHSTFVSEIARVDLCINLRDPTMGETSAVVTQAMQLGTPVIVTDIGWYAELPSFVLKVPLGAGAVDALVNHLARLDADRESLSSLAESTRRYAATELDFTAFVGRYIEILSELASERSRRQVIESALYRDVAVALADLELSDSPMEDAMKAEILGLVRPCL